MDAYSENHATRTKPVSFWGATEPPSGTFAADLQNLFNSFSFLHKKKKVIFHKRSLPKPG